MINADIKLKIQRLTEESLNESATKVTYAGDWVELLRHFLIKRDRTDKTAGTYTLANLLGAVEKVRNATEKIKGDPVTPENTRVVRKALAKNFIMDEKGGYPPVVKIQDAIDGYLKSGKLPKLPSGYGIAGKDKGTTTGEEKVAPGWKAGSFKIAIRSGSESVTGYTKGGLGINNQGRGVWAVTHIATGMAGMRAKSALRASKAGDEWLKLTPAIGQAKTVSDVQQLIKPKMSELQAIVKRYKR